VKQLIPNPAFQITLIPRNILILWYENVVIGLTWNIIVFKPPVSKFQKLCGNGDGFPYGKSSHKNCNIPDIKCMQNINKMLEMAE
jgi:hypothetical protein